jgi:hypothetical protein
MSQTRRLTAILAADVAGYSRLTGEDNGEIGQCGEPSSRYSSHRGALCEWGCLSSRIGRRQKT